MNERDPEWDGPEVEAAIRHLALQNRDVLYDEHGEPLIGGMNTPTQDQIAEAQDKGVVSVMSPSPNWYGVEDENGRPEYHWFDGGGGDAVAWQEADGWRMHYSFDDGAPLHVDLGQTPTFEEALGRADQVIATVNNALPSVELDDPDKTRTVAESDLANVVNLANEIEDIAPAERASLDRLETELGRQPFDRHDDRGSSWDR